jgi:hypothetical protein
LEKNYVPTHVANVLRAVRVRNWERALIAVGPEKGLGKRKKNPPNVSCMPDGNGGMHLLLSAQEPTASPHQNTPTTNKNI